MSQPLKPKPTKVQTSCPRAVMCTFKIPCLLLNFWEKFYLTAIQPCPTYMEGNSGNDLNPQKNQNWDLIISPNFPLRFRPTIHPRIAAQRTKMP